MCDSASLCNCVQLGLITHRKKKWLIVLVGGYVLPCDLYDCMLQPINTCLWTRVFHVAVCC